MKSLIDGRGKAVVLGVFLLLAIICPAKAVVEDPCNIDIYNDTTIGTGEEYGIVNIYESQTVPPIQTTVDMSGGYVEYFSCHDGSILNIQDGTIDNIYAQNLSTVNIIDGNILYVDVSDNATVNITGGSFPESRLIVSDGTLNISGGELNIVYTKFYANNLVNLWGYGFNYDTSSSSITGYLADNNYFSIRCPAGNINLIEIPSPATSLLFGLGTLLLRKRR